MDENEAEATLIALLARLRDNDDPAMADRAIDLYLASFDDDDEDGRRAGLARLTHAMLARREEPGAKMPLDILGALRHRSN